jgi:hypothetical protein
MNLHLIRLAAAFAWAGVAISSATPADAYVRTSSIGTVATCGGTWSYSSYFDTCTGIEYSYNQKIKVSTVACNSGGCTSEFTNRVESLYSEGRKPVSSDLGYCMGAYTYGLGSCAC